MRAGLTRTILVVAVVGAVVPSAARQNVSLSTLTEPSSAQQSARALLDTVERGRASEILQDAFALGGLGARARSTAGSDPILTLSGALETADAIRKQAIADLTAHERRYVLEHALNTGRAGRLLRRDLEADPRLLEIARRADLDAFAAAALTIVASIEQAGPALSLIPSKKLAPAGCPGIDGDVIYESADCSIVIAAPSNNSYSDAADPMLLIDLGGNETYTGDAAFALGTVELLIDVSGDDRYQRTTSFTTPGGDIETITGQGGGALGVGVLADLGGNDHYEVSVDATAPQPGPVARSVGAAGQGVGIIGAGVLVDAAGTDTYTLAATSSGGPADTMGQASAIGAAALLDLGSDADEWVMTATSTQHEIEAGAGERRFVTGAAASAGQGTGILGVAAAVDSAGDDRFSLTAMGDDADLGAQGAGLGGAGILIDGAGNDRMVAEAAGVAILHSVTDDPNACWQMHVNVPTDAGFAIGQGGANLGVGVLLDGGGDDDRHLVGSNLAEGRATVESAVSCSGEHPNAATVTTHAGPGTVIGQAASEAGAVAALVDLGGSDRYRLTAASISSATVTISSPGPETASTTATAEAAVVHGHGYNFFGAALLLDVLGDDSYETTSSTITEETETIDGQTTAISSLAAGDERIQGYSEGLLLAWFIDLDGDDTYASSAGATAADDDTCWSNNPANDDGRGRDLSLAVPSGCP